MMYCSGVQGARTCGWPEGELELLTKGRSFHSPLSCARILFFKSVGVPVALVEWIHYGVGVLFAGRFSLRAMYAALCGEDVARQKRC